MAAVVAELNASPLTCFGCGTPMAARALEARPYTEVDLPHVLLHNVCAWTCPTCNDEVLEIPRIMVLHQRIALALIAKRSRLTAPEIVFLRKHMGWSGVDFAKQMGVKKETVSRWEHGAAIGATADRLLRMFVATLDPSYQYGPADCVDISSKSEAAVLSLVSLPDGWHEHRMAS